MRWDDLDLLRLIYDLEQNEPAALHSGFSLMERSLRRRDLTYEESDPRLLSHELRIAVNAGYLEFDDQSWPGHQMPDPKSRPAFLAPANQRSAPHNCRPRSSAWDCGPDASSRFQRG